MHLRELKDKSIKELVDLAESMGLENVSPLKKARYHFCYFKITRQRRREYLRWRCIRNFARWFWLFEDHQKPLT